MVTNPYPETNEEYEEDMYSEDFYEKRLRYEAYEFLTALSPEFRANWKYRVSEGLLLSGIWVADELDYGELVARTCAVGAAAPLHLLDGEAEIALWDGLSYYDHWPLSDAYEGMSSIGDSGNILLEVLSVWETNNGIIPLPELPTSLKS